MAPEGPQSFPMDNLVCHEKSRWIILLWDDFILGNLGVSQTKGGQRNIWWYDAYFGRFQALKGPPRAPEGPQWFPMDNLVCYEKSRWIILLWDYFTMGDLGVSRTKGYQRNIWFDTFFGHFKALKFPPRAPEGPQWFPMDNLVCHEKSRWIILLWDYFTMGELGVSLTKGNQRYIWWFDAYFGRFQALKGPPRAPEGPQWTT